MKKEDISKIVSDIDKAYIEEAAQIVRKKSPVIKYALTAACVCIAVAAAVFLGNSRFTDPKTPEKASDSDVQTQAQDTPLKYPESGSPEIMTDAALGQESVTAPYFVDLTTPMKYPEIKRDGIIYSTMSNELSADSLGEFLFTTEMLGYDSHNDITYTVNAEIYSIKDILDICAVAAKIDGESEYYVYVNSEYTPETLGDMINDLNLRENLSFGKAYSDYTADRVFTSRTYEDFDDSAVWDMILSDTGVKNISYDRYYDKIVGISVDIPLLGFRNISLGVTKDGYLITNIMHTQKCFFIGVDKAEAFGEYLEANVKYTEASVVYENPDGSVAGKQDAGQSTPGYNPQAGESTPAYNPDAGTGSASAATDFIAEAETQIS